ncbi:MAG: putative two-component histidine kinase [Ilumatobacteraceae bacterium]|nr:putative two-component histidine kinase [Ilumatobacteraceae bacterium]
MNRFPPLQWMRRHPRGADLTVAGILTFVNVGAHWNAPIPDHGRGPSALGTVLVCLVSLPIAFRRRAPIAVLATVAVAQITVDVIGFPTAGWMSLMIAVYTVATQTKGRQRAITAQVFAVAMLALLIGGLVRHRVDVGSFVSAIVLLTAAFILGDNLQRRRVQSAELAESAERAERERELLAQQRAQDERSRIARELHDVVAHSVSLMIIQAGAARRSIATSPAQAEATLHTLEATGRHAMDELRRVLGVLRAQTIGPDGKDTGVLAPQPSLENVRELVDGDPSLQIELAEVGTPPTDLPSSVGLSLYRVVQEALTNVRKHAGHVRMVSVRVTYAPDRVDVQISDDGRGASVAVNEAGHGIVGMRERMALCGGTVTAGPRPGGGWQVRASAPIGSEPRTVVAGAPGPTATTAASTAATTEIASVPA